MANPVTTEEGARRLAKTIIQDIGLYNADKIRKGLAEDSIFDVLADEIKEGRNLYQSRVAPDILQKTNFYDRGINDHLIKVELMKTKGELPSKIFG